MPVARTSAWRSRNRRTLSKVPEEQGRAAECGRGIVRAGEMERAETEGMGGIRNITELQAAMLQEIQLLTEELERTEACMDRILAVLGDEGVREARGDRAGRRMS